MGTRAEALSLLLLAASGTACFDDVAPVPLYDAGNRVGPDQVATLGGYVDWVDGRDVSKLGGAFELLPGCHIVTTPTHWGNENSFGGMSATTGAVTFAVPMRAGYHYLVVATNDSSAGPTFRGRIRMDEMGPAGDPLRSFDRAKTAKEIEDCRQQPGAP